MTRPTNLPQQCSDCQQTNGKRCEVYTDPWFACSKPGGCISYRGTVEEIEAAEQERLLHMRSQGVQMHNNTNRIVALRAEN